MTITTSLADTLTRRLPRVIPAKGHAVADYLVVGSLLGTGAWLWSRNRRAALGALICGGTGLLASLLTDYPGGVAKVISSQAHRKIDLGLAAMVATMPEFMGFSDRREKKIFMTHAAAMTAINNLTDFSPPGFRFARKRPLSRAG